MKVLVPEEKSFKKSSRGKEDKQSVGNKGIEDKPSRETARKPILLEERKIHTEFM